MKKLRLNGDAGSLAHCIRSIYRGEADAPGKGGGFAVDRCRADPDTCTHVFFRSPDSMKIYHFPIAPNPTRVMLFIREKGISIDEEVVSILEGQQRSPEHLARNPEGNLPVLELDDGEFITESLSIVEYLEELYPEPCLIGRTPEERLRNRSLERKAEHGILNPLGRYVHATNSPLGLPPNPAVAEAAKQQLDAGLQRFEEQLGKGPYVAGEQLTFADCTLFAALQFGEFFGVTVGDEYPELNAWYERFKQRPSTQG